MRVAALLVIGLWAPLAEAAPVPCAQTASDKASFDECAQKEILPLETRRVHAMSALRTRYRNDPGLLKMLESSEDSWNAYRSAYCSAEAAVRGGASGMEVRRAFAVCAKRTLELRVKELESLP